MKQKEKLKSVVEGYKPTPFFFKEHREKDTRLVAWTFDLSQLKQLLYRVLQTFPDKVEILLKVVKNPEEYKIKWNRYYGKSSLQKLLKIIKSNEKYVFQDGRNQLCVRRPDASEYIALDDHDILYIYSNSEEFAKLCEEAGFEEREEKLIFESGHWHITPKDADKLKDKFIKDLNLEPIYVE